MITSTPQFEHWLDLPDQLLRACGVQLFVLEGSVVVRYLRLDCAHGHLRPRQPHHVRSDPRGRRSMNIGLMVAGPAFWPDRESDHGISTAARPRAGTRLGNATRRPQRARLGAVEQKQRRARAVRVGGRFWSHLTNQERQGCASTISCSAAATVSPRTTQSALSDLVAAVSRCGDQRFLDQRQRE
jgi:hypothetical protein